MNGFLKQGYGVGLVAPSVLGKAETIGLQSFQRRCRRLYQRYVKPLHRTERLSRLFAQGRTRAAERRQHLLLIHSFRLFACQGVSRRAMDGVEANHIVTAKIRNRARNRSEERRVGK